MFSPAVIPFPDIDPILFEFGPLVIRWYALAYVAGLLLGWRYVLRLNRGPGRLIEDRQIDDLLFWLTLGVILGGRFGYVVFYNPSFYWVYPLEALQIWKGGMSFHGGVLGVAVAAWFFARHHEVAMLRLADLVIPAIPIGLFFGRLANFINGELFGRPSEVAWAMVFPHGGPEPRHPSQLYEALLEGAVLFLVLWWLARRQAAYRRPGLMIGVFLAGYSLSRALVELFRQPDQQIGLLAGGTTMGQWLSAPMLLIGLFLMVRAFRMPGSKT